ncbi:MAG: hypothetical protein R3F14_41795 [Polyangiaceae bacterium]
MTGVRGARGVRRAGAGRLAPVVLLAVCGGMACGGGGCGDAGSGSGEKTAAAEMAPVPAPEDLAMECVVPTPDASWEKARAQVGGPAAFLPRSIGGLVASTLHFPIGVAEAIDGRVPAVCAGTLAKDGSGGRGVLGVHLRWPDRLLDGLTRGDKARFDATTDGGTGIRILKARDAADSILAAGVFGHYLLIAVRDEDLTALGPYVARTMPVRAKEFPATGVRIAGAPEPPAIDFLARVPEAAMAGGVGAVAQRAFTTARERLATSFAGPMPFAGAFEGALALVPHLGGAEVRVVLDGRSTRVEISAGVRKGDAEARVRALQGGDVAPLLAMPRDTLAGLLVRRTPASPFAARGARRAGRQRGWGGGAIDDGERFRGACRLGKRHLRGGDGSGGDGCGGGGGCGRGRRRGRATPGGSAGTDGVGGRGCGGGSRAWWSWIWRRRSA